MIDLDHLLGWPLSKAMAYLSSRGLTPVIQKTSPPRGLDEDEEKGEYRVISVRFAKEQSPVLIISFFSYGINKE